MRYAATLTVPIMLRRDTPRPLYEQIAGQLAAAVDGGELAGDARLPSTRTLAGLLGVSRGVVDAAYDDLFIRGYLHRRSGSGSYVARPAAPAAPPDLPPGGLIDLRPGGGPSPEIFPLRAWRAAWRQASFRLPPADPPDPLGLPELRRAIAQHLRTTRGLPVTHTEPGGHTEPGHTEPGHTEPGHTEPGGYTVVVTGGEVHGIRLLLDLLGLTGRRVAIEDPAPPGLHAAAGGDPAPLPVDRAGARIDAIGPGCRAAVLTPDAHVPLGHVLSERRRRQAASWSARTGGWLIEIAGGAGLPPAACRLPRLASLAGRRVAIAGGFAPPLARGLRLGYLVVPVELARPLARLIADREEQPPHPLQHAVADLLAAGAVGRLTHRLDQLHRRNRRVLEEELRGLVRAGGVRIGGPDVCGTAVLHLPDHVDQYRVEAALSRLGVRVQPLAHYHRRPDHPPGLVIGYGHLPEPALRTGLSALSRCLRAG